MEKIKLEIINITYSQSQSGAYALILGESNGKRRLPIIIGAFEAQSIAIEFENIKPSRPLTHDLFKQFAQTFGVEVKEVIIYKFYEGVFYAKLVCHDGNNEIELDSRTSDAVAIAIRFKCPIYTYENIMESAGIILDTASHKTEDKLEAEETTVPVENKKYATYSMAELQEMLNKAIEEEAYEKASAIRDEINKRKKE